MLNHNRSCRPCVTSPKIGLESYQAEQTPTSWIMLSVISMDVRDEIAALGLLGVC
jgi:hypothetical protein